jgi:uncharacterized SAM-dependent methyltransferase
LPTQPGFSNASSLYDERGSDLFEEICTLEEYYPTRTELALLRHKAVAIAELVAARASVVELGASSSLKARLLLGGLLDPAHYVPVDISAAQLVRQAAEVADACPLVAVHPVLADFTRPQEFTSMARTAGWCFVDCWIDEDARFSVH